MICPSCRENLPEIAERCPFCQEPVQRAAPAPAPPAVQAPPPRPRPPIRTAWESPGEGCFGGWWGTVWNSLIHPRRFNEGLEPRGSIIRAYHYHYFNTLLAASPVLLIALIAVIAALGISFTAPSEIHPLLLPIGAACGLAVVLAPVLLYFVGWAVLGVASVGFHLCGLLFGARNGVGASFRMLAYTGAATPVSMVTLPIGCGIVGTIWSYVMLYHGYRRVHGLSSGRALGAIVLSFLLFVVLPIATVVGLVAGAVIGYECAEDLPHDMRADMRAAVHDFGKAWTDGDVEALNRMVESDPVRAELMATRPVRIHPESLRRQVWFDRWFGADPAREREGYAAGIEIEYGSAETIGWLYMERRAEGWVVTEIWIGPDFSEWQTPCCR